jgi:hypothetical protein
VFPRESSVHAEPDEHFYAVRRPVLGVVLAANLVQMAVFVAFFGWTAVWTDNPAAVVTAFLMNILVLASTLPRGKPLSMGLLGATLAVYVVNLLV